jgi:predicted MFS family arabinose efflux permease
VARQQAEDAERNDGDRGAVAPGQAARRPRRRRRADPDAVRRGLLFALFLLCSFYLQNVLGTGPLATGIGLIPLALAAGVGAHAGGRLVNRAGVRMPLAAAFAVTAVGMAFLSTVESDGSYLRDVLPGMLIAGLGLGVALVSVSVAMPTGARHEETGMLSGLNTTGHELGGTIGIAVFGTIAASATGAIAGPPGSEGIANAFLAAAVVASAAGLVALIALPRPAGSFRSFA